MTGNIEEAADIVIPKRRQLSDLYRIGYMRSFRGPVQLEDDTIEMVDIPIWISKLSQLEERECGNKASHARGALQAITRQPMDHSDWDDYRFKLLDYGLTERKDHILFLIESELDEFRTSAREKLSHEKEWSDDDYLISLEDAWNASIYEKYIEDSEDPEAKRVFEALKKFMDQIDKEIEAEKINLIESFHDDSDEEVLNKVLKKLVESESNVAFVNEFRCWQVYFAMRDIEDHSKRYFGSRDELDYLDDNILNSLKEAFLEISIDSMEGKD